MWWKSSAVRDRCDRALCPVYRRECFCSWQCGFLFQGRPFNYFHIWSMNTVNMISNSIDSILSGPNSSNSSIQLGNQVAVPPIQPRPNLPFMVPLSIEAVRRANRRSSKPSLTHYQLRMSPTRPFTSLSNWQHHHCSSTLTLPARFLRCTRVMFHSQLADDRLNPHKGLVSFNDRHDKTITPILPSFQKLADRVHSSLHRGFRTNTQSGDVSNKCDTREVAPQLGLPTFP